METNFADHEFLDRAKLPVSINDFETMRTQGYVYVDKTPYIYRMVTQGKFYFLSRPRRFGKSVLITTLKCLYEGRKKLFEGLWIAEQGKWDWQKHPVVLLDFTGISNDTPEHLQQGLETCLLRIAGEYDIQLKSPLLMSKFTELILGLSQQTGMSVAVLIDEYDKPIIDHLGKGPQEFTIAKANRDVLKRFFGVLKDVTIAPKLQFIFLTGVTRFSKVSIFSELNNLDDISMHDAYAALLGYTQEELERYFTPYIRQLSEHLNWSEEQVLAKLAEQYNGYRFAESEIKVYNPCSILKCLNLKKFDDFWFETATPTFLINVLKQMDFYLPDIEGVQVSKTIFSTFDIEQLEPTALLFQTGYVTITDVQGRLYTLAYPNQEVRRAFTESLLLSLTREAQQDVNSHVLRLTEYLRHEDFDAFFETMTAIFAAIPYDIESKRDEAYFHALFYLMLTASGADARSSVLTCKGRIDMAVFFPNLTYIIEFKCNQHPEAALQQIHDKGYAEPYRADGKPIILIGIEFSPEQRNIVAWKVEHFKA
ncbi:AAA-ATPase [Candidatus Vecturithrix granuli]|uniref:AAA-ATPase n=1 Tax=Vecturithrix granuli TaxID=1499967 RepID=A0A081CAW5_VECG1|nr:AAA-ATPase [Candidatus Vecturithrix granuli]